MPRVIITRYAYAHTNEDALQMAREARMSGMRSEIISDKQYEDMLHDISGMQDLTTWANNNNVEFKPAL